MAKRKPKTPRNKPAKKRTAARPQPPIDTPQVVADIVHTLGEKKFGTKLTKKDNSKPNGNPANV
jgi:hypothetical protein